MASSGSSLLAAMAFPGTYLFTVLEIVGGAPAQGWGETPRLATTGCVFIYNSNFRLLEPVRKGPRRCFSNGRLRARTMNREDRKTKTSTLQHASQLTLLRFSGFVTCPAASWTVQLRRYEPQVSYAVKASSCTATRQQ